MTHTSPTEPGRENDPTTAPAGVGEWSTSHQSSPETGSLTESPAKDFPDEPLPPTTGGRKSSRWLTVVSLVIAVIAVGLAIGSWFRPTHSASPAFTSQQISDAKTNVCAAYTTVQQAVVINTHLVNPRPDDPIGQLAVAANARLALLGAAPTYETASPQKLRLQLIWRKPLNL